MYSDVIDLRDFYASSLGQAARRMIRRRIRATWPTVAGETVLGLGYATPYLRMFRDEAARVVGIMPAQQGVLHWPPQEPNLVTISDDVDLPLPDISVDRVLLIHLLECTEQLRPTLREIWRVLADSGRLLIVVPNRSGIWTRVERTPFGWGQPYSAGQLSRLLRDNMFTPNQVTRALYMPPAERRLLLRSAAAFENIGDRLFPMFAGVLSIEAGKQIYAATPIQARQRRRLLIPMPTPSRGAAKGAGRSSRDG